MMYGDGRRLPPRNARGEFRRRRRGDRRMGDYGYDMRRGDMRDYGDMARGGGRGRDRGMDDYGMYDMRGQDYGDMARGGRGGNRGGGQGGRGRGGDRAGGDYGDYDMARGQDYRGGDYRGGDYGDMRGGSDYGDMGRGGDGHYMHGGMGGYMPIEAMGYFNGYYGRGDMARGGRRDYGGDYGDDYGDFGETLSEKELEHWNKKLMSQLDEREKQMFSKEAIIPKFKQMGIEMKGFGEEELYTATLTKFTDHKKSIGANPDLAIKLARDFLIDPDSNVKGAERLAVYYDTFVEED